MFLRHNAHMETLAARIKSSRKMRGLTQQQLANKLDIDQGFISRLERDEKGITIDLLNRLAKLLDVPLAYLLGESNSTQQEKLPVPSGLKALEQDQALTETLNISEPEWLAMKTILLPAETNKEGYVQLLYTIRAITK